MRYLLKTRLSQLLILPLYALFFFVFLIGASQPAFAITGQVLDQNGKNITGVTITMSYNGTNTPQSTTGSGYAFADPCPFAQNGQPGSAPFTVSITVPNGYFATTATTVDSTGQRGEFLQPGTGCGQMMVNGKWEHYPTTATPETVNFGITTTPPACTSTPINCSACTAPANTCSNGNGTQTCTLSQPQTCSAATTTQSCTINNCNAGSICTNQVCQVPTYSISGNVFTDLNKNKLEDNGETNYPATPPISLSPNTGTVKANADGSYSITNIIAGTYSVIYGTPPTNYYMTSPLTGPPNAFSVTVGGSCNVNGTPGATCTAGAISNLNFGISNTNPWYQSICGDIRNDNGIIDTLPASISPVVAASPCTTAGLVFTGNINAKLGSGQASQVVGGTNYPEVYPASYSPLSTSYPSLLSKATTAGITPIDITTTPNCTLSSCTLSSTLSHGIYSANGALTLNTWTAPANQDYVFLVNGNLTINGPITVPVGSTVLFSTKGNITVASGVGTTTFNSATPTIAGWYVAGGSFILPSAGNCADTRLNIAGSVIVNALGTGGTFQNNRDLCGNDTVDPTVSFIQRLDMIFNAPQFLQQQVTLSQEVSP